MQTGTQADLNIHNQNLKLEPLFPCRTNTVYTVENYLFPTYLKSTTQILFLKKHLNVQGSGELRPHLGFTVTIHIFGQNNRCKITNVFIVQDTFTLCHIYSHHTCPRVKTSQY